VVTVTAVPLRLHRRPYYTTDILVDEGHPVATARDGQEALEVIEVATPAVVVSDVTMPRLDGLALVRRLREHCIGVRVVLVTARPVRADLPGVRVLPKPFALDELVDAVARCLEAGG
jgi:CheY-like chemotaxis protein